MLDKLVLPLFEISLTMSAVILLIILLSPLLQKRYAANIKYWIWLAIGIRLLVPLQVPAFQATAPVQMPVSDYTIIEVAPPAQMTDSVAADDVPENETPTTDGVVPQPEPYANTKENTAAQTEQSAESARDVIEVSVLDIVMWVWMAGTACACMYYMVGYIYFRNHLRNGRTLPRDSRIAQQVDFLRRDIGVRRNVHVVVLERATSPFITGLFRTTLVLPKTQYDAADLDLIIRHELTHCKRGDLWYKLLFCIVCAVHWFNPAVYLMRKSVEQDVEHICDALVLRGKDMRERKSYSEMILLCAEHKKGLAPPLSTSFSADAKTLKERFQNIMTLKNKKRGMHVVLAALLCMILAGNMVACSVKDTMPDPEAVEDAAPLPTAYNILTGEVANSGAENLRPYAVVVSNISWGGTPSGLSSADILIEGEYGGMTQMLALYSDLRNVGEIGPPRDAQSHYFEMAYAADPIFVYELAWPWPPVSDILEQEDIDAIELSITPELTYKDEQKLKANYAYENALYTSGIRLLTYAEETGMRITRKDGVSPFLPFAKPGETVSLAGGAAEAVFFEFVTSSNDATLYDGDFRYDAASEKYLKFQRGNAVMDHANIGQLAFTNVIVLFMPSIQDSSESGLSQVGSLYNFQTGGTGYYFSGGRYEALNWEKAEDFESNFVFTRADGSAMQFHTGNTMLCFVSMNKIDTLVIQ